MFSDVQEGLVVIQFSSTIVIGGLIYKSPDLLFIPKHHLSVWYCDLCSTGSERISFPQVVSTMKVMRLVLLFDKWRNKLKILQSKGYRKLLQ